jgi:hypothetical protein
MNGLALALNLGKWRIVCAGCILFEGLVEHFQVKRKAHIGDHPVIEIGQDFLVPIGADARRPEVYASAGINHLAHRILLLTKQPL